jgi:hypothetical protein
VILFSFKPPYKDLILIVLTYCPLSVINPRVKEDFFLDIISTVHCVREDLTILAILSSGIVNSPSTNDV